MGEPAFPQLKYKDTEHFDGMTLRDYFAAKAMLGYLIGNVKAYENISIHTTKEKVRNGIPYWLLKLYGKWRWRTL